MNTIKFVLFGVLKRINNYLSGTGISQKIPVISKIYDFLIQQTFPYQNIIESQGSKMYVNVYDQDPAMRWNFQAYTCHDFERSMTRLFKKVVKPGDVVVDIGANIGYYTLLASRLVGKDGLVYSFEPEPRNYNYLLKSIELNKYNNVIAIQKAVTDISSKAKLYLCPYDASHHIINQYGGIKTYRPNFAHKKDFIEVEVVSLDNYFKDFKQQIDVVKIDVEGAEMLALLGMDRIIKESKNLKMFVEFFPLLLKEMGSSPEEFISKLLNDYKFSVFVIPDAPIKKIIKINNSDELMDLCKGERDVVNLFITK